MKKYRNIKLTKRIKNANAITHSGKFHVDDVMATVFLSKIKDNIILSRVPTTDKLNLDGKIVYDIGYGEFDHHQKNRNGKRKNGIYYSSIGLLWKKYGKDYLKNISCKYVDEVFNYMDTELIQYIDATDNMQNEYLKNKTSPDFVKLCNPEWNENVDEDIAFLKAVKLGDEFWQIYIKHAIAEVEAIKIILNKVKNAKKNYVIFEQDMPYRKALNLLKGNKTKVKYFIFKSRREGYDIRALFDEHKFNEKLATNPNINDIRNFTNIKDILYVDVHGKLCCTQTIESAKKIIQFNDFWLRKKEFQDLLKE